MSSPSLKSFAANFCLAGINSLVINPGSIIMAGVTIGKNSIIAVGSIVSKDVPDYTVVAGNPARVIKKIDH